MPTAGAPSDDDASRAAAGTFVARPDAGYLAAAIWDGVLSTTFHFPE
jgi:hypothetical protein